MQVEDLVLRQFPGKVMISLVEAGSCIGLARRTSYNLAHKKQFPLPIRKVSNKSMVALTDVIDYIKNGSKPAPQEKEEIKRRPGRPTKAEQVKRMRQLGIYPPSQAF